MARTGEWAAVVVNYRAGALLAACVDAVVSDRSAGAPEVVVVDNGSDDGSVALLEQSHPEVPVVRPGANLGYGRAANLGIAATAAPIVAVLNPDVEIEPGTAAAILRCFDVDPRLAAVGPSIHNPDGSWYPSARRAPALADAVGHALLGGILPGNRFTRAYRELDADPAVAREVDWCSGAAVWLRRSALDRVGGWDEGFFMFFEDVDLCRRLEADGWRIAYEPAGRVVHVVGASRSGRRYRSIYWHHRAAYRYAAKWWRGPRRLLLPFAAAFLALRGVVLGAREALRARPGTAAATE
ncbi:MAG: glycosyltransferase family 2 protein [Actinobacteria bacterium]|nr:glycosyltransferase family 2 protein [Actinomycetota bacterium]